jgi:hypothetical protein
VLNRVLVENHGMPALVATPYCGANEPSSFPKGCPTQTCVPSGVTVDPSSSIVRNGVGLGPAVAKLVALVPIFTSLSKYTGAEPVKKLEILSTVLVLP